MLDLSLNDLIEKALKEDVGTGDITTLSTIPADKTITGRFIAKETGILCGVDVVRAVFAFVDPSIVLEFANKDGDKIVKGDVVVIAGKGHENYQDVKGVKHHFDDKEVIREMFV